MMMIGPIGHYLLGESLESVFHRCTPFPILIHTVIIAVTVVVVSWTKQYQPPTLVQLLLQRVYGYRRDIGGGSQRR
jgi:hypothetical protein